MRAGLFISAARIWMSLCGVGATVAALWFLDPQTFGVYAVASSIGLFFFQFVSAGAQEAYLGGLIAQRDAHAFSTLTGFVAAGLLAAAAAVAGELGSPLAAATLGVFGVSSVLQGLAQIPDARATREGRGERIFVAVAFGDTVSLVATVAGLMAGWGGYALAFGKLAQQVAYYAAFSALMRELFLPLFSFANLPAHCRRFSAYALPRLSGWADGYAADIVIGALLSPVAAGQFRLAARFSAAFQAIVTNSLNVVLLAEVGKRAHQALKAARVMRVSPVTIVLAGFVSVGFSIVVAAALARFGKDGWSDAATIVLWLGVATPALVLNGALIALLTGHDATRLLASVQIARLVASNLGMTAGAAIGPAWAAAGRSLLTVAVAAGSTPRALRARAQTRRLVSPLLRQSAVALGVAVLGALLAKTSDGIGSIPHVAALIGFALALQAALTFPELKRAGAETRRLWSRRARREVLADAAQATPAAETA